MAKSLSILANYSDPIIDISLNTINLNKQAIVFVNTKRGAESQAEKIAMKIKTEKSELFELSEKILNVLSKPTRQCTRLANCIKRGIAFHHAGLASKQRELVEDNFRAGLVKVICATPTLAMGLDMPAFRVIVRDLKRYGGPWGMTDIPVLEYEQQAGRAGRPGHEDYGEAICIAKTEVEKENIFEKYVHGEPESIYSKLAVEPVLRTYVLSLIATDFVRDRESLFRFFDKTFYAHQYSDLDKLHLILEKIIGLLDEWEFIKLPEREDFVSGNEIGTEKYEVTLLGKRVSELYLDPYTAHFIITCLRKATSKHTESFSYIGMVTSCLEIRPLLRVKISEYETVQEKMLPFMSSLLKEEPSQFSEEYDEFLNSMKTALFFQDWINEFDEEYLMENYDIRPGEIKAKQDIADWLLYSAEELARILQFQPLIKDIIKLRFRLKHGAKEELLPLIKLRGIGRVRARKMFKNKMKSLTDIKSADIMTLAQLIGKAAAISVKKQLGQEFDPKKIIVKENKRKGQISLKDYETKKK